MSKLVNRFSISGSTTTDLIAYITILGTAIQGLITLPTEPGRIFALALLIIFTLLFILSPASPHLSWNMHAYLGVQTLLVSVLMALLPEKQWIFAILFFVLSSQAVTITPSPVCYVWIGVFTLASGIIFGLRLGMPAGLYDLLPFTGGYFFFGAFTYAWAEADAARRENQRLLSKLADEHRRLQEYTARVEALTEAQERSRIAREIHDTLGHTLTTLDVQLELLKRLPPEQEYQRRKVATQAQDLVRQGLADTRRSVRALQPVGLEDLSLKEVISALVNSFYESSNIPVDWDIGEAADGLTPRLVLPLYRVVQEALTNIRRHAPTTTSVAIRLDRNQTNLRMQICNTPPVELSNHSSSAASHMEGGRGLMGLQERIEALGGSFSAGPTSQGGFQIIVEIPQNPPVIIR